jgi:hypothetical protein
MYVNEEVFGHLREAADQRQRRELEHRRIARERAAAATPTARRSLREFVQGFRHPHGAPRRLSHS